MIRLACGGISAIGWALSLLNMQETTSVEFYFDVLCPFAWRTSLWMRDVAQQLSIDVTWKQFSLAIINKADPESTFMHKDLTLGRLAIAAGRLGGNTAVDRLYLALGDAIHGQQLDPLEPTVLEGALTAAGLPAELLETVLADETTEEDYRAEHAEGVARGGFGVPLLVFDSAASGYFGPVIDPVPTGPAALELWEFTRWAAQQPYLFEIKRQRTGGRLGPQRATVSFGDPGTLSEEGVDACAWVPTAR
jgi:2-hydroxychromene-2-carboxylate isomerase